MNMSVNTVVEMVANLLRDPKNQKLEELLGALLKLKNRDPNALANRIALCLAAFENLTYRGPDRPALKFSEAVWQNFSNQIAILKDLETKIDLLVILDPVPAYQTCAMNYRGILETLKDEPSEGRWNRITDSLHSLVRFETEVRKVLLERISLQGNRAAAVIGAIPNHPEIEEMNGLLKELEGKE